jgi:SPP1 family predicted phage head-tail adaptor
MTIKDIGELDRRIMLRNPATATDSFGQSVRTYSNVSNIWAKVDFTSGLEKEDGNRLESIKRVEFLIRYNTAVTEISQISWDGDTFEIEAVLPMERKRFMHLITRLVD